MTTIKKITIWKLLLVMVMISMLASACGGRKTPSATPAPTPANTPVPLPPVLVETSPLANSQLGARSPITFYFDQPMQRSAVEGALKLDPATPGRFEWLDDATVRFVPDADLPSASQVKVSIGSSALSKQGQALVNPVDLNFTTAGALLVAEKLPSPGSNEVDPTSAVVVTFNQPVIALGGEPSDAKPAFSISPAVKGTGKWLNTSTYIFYPEKSMDGGKTYQVSLDGDLKSVSGSPLESGQALGWNFSTAMPALISIEPATDVPLWRDGKVTITFNQPMDQKTVEENVELAPAGGPALAVSYAWNDTGTSLTIQPKELMEYGATVNLTLKSGVSALGGQAIGFSESYLYKVVEPFQVTGTSPGAT
ncbi:MAG: hypothetical protein HGA53_07540, partial [Anaerolineaceae bacterium]|nr:hypothetical protein [Anaerolineaceae bacterium]